MFGEGLVEEAVGLRARYGKVRPLDAIGYRQALAVADGTLDEGTAIALTARILAVMLETKRHGCGKNR